MNPVRVLLISLTLLGAKARADGPTLAGRWKDSERGLLVEFTVDDRATWTGTVLEAKEPREVGKKVFQGLAYEDACSCFRGQLLKPDDDELVSATVTATKQQLTAVVKKFIFSKTLVLTRVATAAEKRPPTPAEPAR